MTPEQIAKADTEHAHQAAYFCWIQKHGIKEIDPRLEFTLAIPNGGLRNKVTASRLRAEGVKKGVADVFVPIPTWEQYENPATREIEIRIKHCGLWLEFKKPSLEKSMNGMLKDPDQIKFREYVLSQNYFHFVPFNYLQAINATLNYLSQV